MADVALYTVYASDSFSVHRKSCMKRLKRFPRITFACCSERIQEDRESLYIGYGYVPELESAVRS